MLLTAKFNTPSPVTQINTALNALLSIHVKLRAGTTLKEMGIDLDYSDIVHSDTEWSMNLVLS